MYRNDHTQKYRMLPIYINRSFAEPFFASCSEYFIKRPDSDNVLCCIEHRHEAIELLYVQTGEIEVKLEDRVYTVRGGELAIVNPFIEHSINYTVCDKPMSYLCIQFELGSFMPPMNSELNACFRKILNGKGHFIEHIDADKLKHSGVAQSIDHLVELWQKNDSSLESDCLRLSKMYEILYGFISHFHVDKPIDGKVRRDLKFIRLVVDYLSEHYKEDLTTSKVCEELSYNISHFCRTFRAHFGTSFSKYLCEYRIMQAMDQYKISMLMVSEVAAAVGFRDYGYFAQSFKQYTGVSPAKFFAGRV